MIDQHFNGQVIIIPGRELEEISVHYIELDLTGNGSRLFRFLAHPGYPGNAASRAQDFSGIEIENAMHNWHIDKPNVKEIAQKHGLILLSNSDAHYLRDVGKCYNEITLEELGL
jgi:hypothetical protein